jgi:hypothetical protein
MTKGVWLAGVAVVLALWGFAVTLVGWATGRTAEVASDGLLLAPLTLFVAAWTGVWLSSGPSADGHRGGPAGSA